MRVWSLARKMRAGARKPRECSETAPSPAVEIVEPLGHRYVARGLRLGGLGLVRIRNGPRIDIDRIDIDRLGDREHRRVQLVRPVLRLELLVGNRFIALGDDGRET